MLPARIGLSASSANVPAARLLPFGDHDDVIAQRGDRVHVMLDQQHREPLVDERGADARRSRARATD